MDWDKTKCLYETAVNFEWQKWANEIPYLQFPANWMVKAIPPFSTGIIRYLVTKPGLNDRVSVYLDCYDQAGFMGQPYWEIYPIDGDCERFLLNETDKLIDGISRALAAMSERKPE